MKRVIIILSFCLVAICIYGQEYYMYVNGQKRTFEVSATKMLVKSETLDAASIKNTMQKAVANSIKNVFDLNNRLAMVDMQNVTKENILVLQKQWNAKGDASYASPVLLDETGNEIGGFTNQVIIRLKSVDDYSLLTKTIKAYHIKTIKSCDFDRRTYLLTLDKDAERNAMQTANELYETGLFDYAEPNLIHFLQLSTSDQFFLQQWSLNNTGQSGGTVGVDIKAPQAWNITTGSPNIRVAVLDVGVELNHPDLVNNLLPGFDATGNNSNGAPINNTGDNAHGTACAGIVAAQANNTIGIAGVAYGCRILPVRIAARSSGWTTTESQFIANGINWARTNGADVISMSFGCLETTALNTTITTAVDSGRSNRGCVLVAASGNSDGSTVMYPASSNNVIAVGAISQCGQRKSPSSCDGEDWWGSNYGTALDVVAPGVNIYTTDLQGSAGYNDSDGTDGNYVANFNGTSSATPHVASIAALILSVRPDLTQTQVRNAIESTCTKLSAYSFSNNSAHPNGSWNNQVGHGLVNAYAAVNSVAPYISGPDRVCMSGESFTITNLPSGVASITWTYSGMTLTSQSTNGSSNFSVQQKNEIEPIAALSPVTYASSTGWIKANIHLNSGIEIPISKSLVVGTPPGRIMGAINDASGLLDDMIFSGKPYRFTAIDIPPNTASGDIRWRIASYIGRPPFGTFPINRMDVGKTITTSFAATPTRMYITMQWQDACGYSVPVTREYTIHESPPSDLISTYPNPVSDILNIVFDQSALTLAQASLPAATDGKQLKQDPAFDIRLYDNQGALLRHKKTKGGTVQFNVASLPNGIYYLHIYDGVNEKPEIRQIMVEH